MLRATPSALIIPAVLVIGCGNGSKCPAGQEPPPCSGGQPCTCENNPFPDKADAGPIWICAD
jgi:hypothetical protein